MRPQQCSLRSAAVIQCPGSYKGEPGPEWAGVRPRAHSALMAELGLEPMCPNYQPKASSSITTQVPSSSGVTSHRASPAPGLCTEARAFPPAHQAWVATFGVSPEGEGRPRGDEGCRWHAGEMDLKDRAALQVYCQQLWILREEVNRQLNLWIRGVIINK